MDYPGKSEQREDNEKKGTHAKNFDADRWAQLIANGDAEFPDDLPTQVKADLIAKVSQLRRSRLLTYIARAIADDILRARGST